MSKKNELDQFTDDAPVKAVSKPITEAWQEERKGENQEAICVVCDALFTPTHGRPPILCPTCKTGLNELLQRDTGL